ncbi:hypothetical protein L9F63_012182, partial [Diploptera punctata]
SALSSSAFHSASRSSLNYLSHLTLCDFYLWGSLKDKVNSSRTDGRQGRSVYFGSSGAGVFPCMGCGNIYRHKRSLQKHIRLECGKEPQFHCPYCPMKMKQKGNLQKHVRKQHEEKGKLQCAYGDACIGASSVRRWERVDALIRDDRRITVNEIATKLA